MEAAVGEEGERGRWVQSPQTGLEGASRLPEGASRRRLEEGRGRRGHHLWATGGFQAEEPAGRHPEVGEAVEVESRHITKGAEEADLPRGRSRRCWLVWVKGPREGSGFWVVEELRRRTSLAGCRRTA